MTSGDGVAHVDEPSSRTSKAKGRFTHALGEFMATCDAYRALIAHAPEIGELDRDRPELLRREFNRLTQALSADDRRQTKALLDEYLTAHRPRQNAGDDRQSDKPRDIPPAGSMPVQPREGEPEEVSAAVAFAMNSLTRFMFLHDHAHAKLPLYLSSLLTTQVAAVETLMGHLLAAFYWDHPEALTSGKSLPLSELHQFATIDDALESVIDTEVDSFRRGGLDDWARWFEKYPKLRFQDLAMHHAGLVEVFARRNVIVHNDGRASNQYQRTTGQEVALGTLLLPDSSYLERANDDLLVFGSLLAAALWRKTVPGDAHGPNHWISDLAFELMVADRWRAVQAISRLARATLSPPAGEGTVHQFNEWLAVKRLTGADAIRELVMGFDLSALHPRFALAAAALSDDMARLQDMIPAALDARHIGMWDVHNWPMFSEFRATPSYADLMATREPWRSPRRKATGEISIRDGRDQHETNGLSTDPFH